MVPWVMYHIDSKPWGPIEPALSTLELGEVSVAPHPQSCAQHTVLAWQPPSDGIPFHLLLPLLFLCTPILLLDELKNMAETTDAPGPSKSK